MGQDSPNLDVARPGHYRFGDVEVDIPAHTLKRAGELQAIEPKAFAVLLALLQRPGELVGHEELLDGVWGHRHVT
ncbi:MAG TPA: winged helix-turn-helix domain-containing protein, partial [Luteimonas sp.]|nr:winged helix-turn-helix domain-containing protein [Luteimonas sp.]